MRIPNAIGPTYSGRSKFAAADRLYNMIPEIVEAQDGKNNIIYFGRPGLTSWSVLGSGDAAVRDMCNNKGVLYAVSGTSFYSVASNGIETSQGTVSASGDAKIVGNGVQILIVVNNAMFCYTIATDTFASVSPGFVPDSIAVFGPYFIANEVDTFKFWISNAYDGTTWTGTDFDSKEGYPDNLVGVFVDHRELWLPGNETTEVWYDSGNALFPFERMPGGFIEKGCVAIDTMKKFDNTIIWVAPDKTVWRADGYTPKRISWHNIEWLLKQSSDLTVAKAFVFHYVGHIFYVLFVPDLDTTLVYDVSTGYWSEWSYLDTTHTPFIGRCHANCYGFDLIGSRNADGIIYKVDATNYQDGSDDIRRERIFPYLNYENKTLKFDTFELNAKVGVGLNVAAGEAGYDPQVNLSCSDDRGNTWDDLGDQSLGTYQSYTDPIPKWSGPLGAARERIFRIYSDEPVEHEWVDAYVGIKKGVT